MAIVINGYTLPAIAQGKTYRESLDEQLKTLTVVYYDAADPVFKPYDLANVDGVKWLVGSYRSELVSRAAGSKQYRITLTLVELTKILERYTLSPCAFSNSADTLYEQAAKACFKSEVKRSGESSIFNFSSTGLYPKLNAVSGEEFFFNEPATLREVLDTMLGVINCRITVFSMLDDYSTIYLGYLDLADQSDDIKTLANYGKTVNQSIEYLASDYETTVQNALTKERRTVKDEWTLLKPVFGGIADTNNVRLIANSPIEEIISVKAKYEATYNYNDGSTGSYVVVQEQDISDRFVEKEIYDTLSLTEQENHIPYTRGSKDIGVLETYKVMFWSQTKLENVFYLYTQAAAIAYIEAHNPGANYTSCAYPSGADTWTDALFQITYVPYSNLHFRQGKDNAKLSYPSVLFSNQTERTTDITRYSRSIRTLANKLGNKTAEYDFVAPTTVSLLDLGDRIADDFTLIEREYSVFDNRVKAHYVFMQHYAIALTSKLSRERRLYNIPIENIIDRDILIKEYLILNTESDPINDGALGDANTLGYFLYTFDGTSDPEHEINRAIVETVDKTNAEYKTFSLGLLKNAVGNSMLIQFGMFDNYSVGLSTGSRTIGGRVVHLNPYCDSNGECVYLKVRFINSNIDALTLANQLILGNAMPIIPDTMIAAYTHVSYSDLKSYIIYKDRFEKITISYQLEAKSADENIIVGDSFAKYSNLLFGKNTTPLYLWYSATETYKETDTQSCIGTLSETTPTIDIANSRVYIPTLPTCVSWAIGDSDGNLIFAVNSDTLNSVYFTVSRTTKNAVSGGDLYNWPGVANEVQSVGSVSVEGGRQYEWTGDGSVDSTAEFVATGLMGFIGSTSLESEATISITAVKTDIGGGTSFESTVTIELTGGKQENWQGSGEVTSEATILSDYSQYSNIGGQAYLNPSGQVEVTGGLQYEWNGTSSVASECEITLTAVKEDRGGATSVSSTATITITAVKQKNSGLDYTINYTATITPAATLFDWYYLGHDWPGQIDEIGLTLPTASGYWLTKVFLVEAETNDYYLGIHD